MPHLNLTPPRRHAARLSTLLAVGALALTGCAAISPKTPEEIVTQRAEARWEALIKGDFDKAWTYTQPAYRAIVKQADYRKSFGVAGQWRGVQVHGVECEAERCKARIRLTTRVLIPDFKRQDVVGIVDETWVRVDGSWWYYQNF
ncbi:MAG: hypothetical protein LCH72_05705 [Proteobacteria bacterium]|nr:hypothetical protein [Burkholderiales bacterium]MCA0310166.1 hypothetical protein [Pseudomonadota bacterium]